MIRLFIILIWLLPFIAVAQESCTLVGHLLYPQGLSGIWGYTDNEGREYALVGTKTGLSIVDINEPTTPLEVAFIPGNESIWREVRTWDHYAYATTEAGGGLMIVDLSQLPDAAPFHYETFNGELDRAHALHIDEYGYAYITGFNDLAGSISFENKGILLLNLNPDAYNPTISGKFTDSYVHDVFVRANWMYTAEIYRGGFGVYDITDKANPVFVAFQNTPSGFTHNCWLSDNLQYLYVTDEKNDAPISAWKIADLQDIQNTDNVKVLPGTQTMPHNVFVKDDFLVLSSYTAGVRIFDAQNPYNIIETGWYDTNPASGGGSQGCWGVYPYFPSGLIIASDRTEGMFIIDPVYRRAVFMEGIITDDVTHAGIDKVKIQLSGLNYYDLSDVIGYYSTGAPSSGYYDVTYSRYGYYDLQRWEVSLNDETTRILDAEMHKKPPIDLQIKVLSGAGISPAQTYAQDEVVNEIRVCDEENKSLYPDFVPGIYYVGAGRWGYHNHFDYVSLPDTDSLYIHQIILKKYYIDDFFFDLGWTVETEAKQGGWVRNIPGSHPSLSGRAPLADIADDDGLFCYITGNSYDNQLVDLDSGYTRLSTPVMDLSRYNAPEMQCRMWYYPQEIAPERNVEIFFDNGLEQISLLCISDTSVIGWQKWDTLILPLKDYLLTDKCRFYFVAKASEAAKVMKVALDKFSIIETSTEEDFQYSIDDEIHIFPNPADGDVYMELADLNGDEGKWTVQIFDATGRQYFNGELAAITGIYKLPLPYRAGLFFVKFEKDNGETKVCKVIKN